MGARLIGHTLTGPQWELVDLLDDEAAPRVARYRDPVVLLPRRVGKTTGIMAVLVGRCVRRRNYQATYVAQSGVKSRERYVTLRRELDQNAGQLAGWKARESRGEERIEFQNGSVLRFLPPKQESFRGDAGDVVVLDEAQEIDSTDGAELVGAILPLFDTRPGGGQLIVSGTAGEARAGLLWDALVEAREGRRGVLEYSADDDADPLDDAVVVAAHPGIGTLTTLELILERRDKMGAAQFAREYLGQWPLDAASTGLTPERWEAQGTEPAPIPRRFGLAFDVTPDRSGAAVAATWTGDDGRRRVELLEARPGSAWVAPFVLEVLAAPGRGRIPVRYNAAGGALDVAVELSAAPGERELIGLGTAAYASACALFVAAVVEGRLVHHRQPQLDDAVARAGRRRIGDGLWGWGARASSGDVSALVAATVSGAGEEALPQRTRRRVVLTAPL